MKILGIDYGEKRIGLAISDETQTLARELEIVSPQAIMEKLASLILSDEIGTIVVGLPINMDGQPTPKTEETQKFIEKLKQQFSVSIETFDERLSSKMAQSITHENKNLDSLAAQIILQNYLDKTKAQSVHE